MARNKVFKLRNIDQARALKEILLRVIKHG